MRSLRVLAGTTVSAVLLAGLAACGSGGGADAGAATPARAAPFRVVGHAMGETTIPARPKRVVALDQSFVDAVLTLETPVVGYTTYRSIETSLPAYLGPLVGKYAKDAVSVGTLEEPSLERIAALKPDLIVSAKVRHEALYDKLSKIAPTVFSVTTGAIWKDNLRLMGRALGKEDLAEAKIKAYQDRATKIGDEIRTKDGKLPTISIVRFAGEPTTRLYVENSYSGVVMKDVGFPRPEGQPTRQDAIAVDVSAERIRDLDADQLFVATYPDPSSDGPKEKFVNNPLWGKLKGEKHEVSDLTWMTAVGIQGAHSMLGDVATIFGVDPAAPAA